MVNPNSSYYGLIANSVNNPEIQKPLYEKVKVNSLNSNISKQTSINDLITVETHELGQTNARAFGQLSR